MATGVVKVYRYIFAFSFRLRGNSLLTHLEHSVVRPSLGYKSTSYLERVCCGVFTSSALVLTISGRYFAKPFTTRKLAQVFDSPVNPPDDV